MTTMASQNKENFAPPDPEVSPTVKSKKTRGLPKKARWSTVDDNTLVDVLNTQQAAGNQADNSWKKVVWIAAEQALAGSENLSGGAAKKAKGCNDRWNTVHFFISYSMTFALMIGG